MGGHALLIGCPRNSPRGSEHDVRAMQAMLEKRGFAVQVYVGAAASRELILDGYDKLIAAVQPGEPAVFYYTGHGFQAFSEAAPTRSWQGIYPVDKDETTTDDFRGITSWELSLKQMQLTKKTPNVTVILDCCYAAQMSRDAAVHNAAPRALPHPVRCGFAAHLEALRAKYPDVFDTALGPVDNPDAVRLVACGQEEWAFEYEGSDGEHRGVFTEALLDVLGEVDGAPVSWAAIFPSIRARVMNRFPAQCPGIEGPADRLLFKLSKGGSGGAAALLSKDDGYIVLAGAVMGVSAGDVFGVMPSGSTAYRTDDALAEAEVTRVSATMSDVTVRHRNSSGVPEGAIAFPLRKVAPRHAVAIDVPDGARSQVASAIAATATLRLAEPQDVTVLPVLRLTGDELTIVDRIGPLFPSGRFPDELQPTVQNLANLGAAQRLRALDGEHGVRADELEVEWGTVERGERQPMPHRGAWLGLRDRLYVRVRSRTERALHIHVFNIGLRGEITRLTPPTGILLSDERNELLFGQNQDGKLVGLSLRWPERMPRETPRTDAVAVIATTMATDLQGLETTAYLSAPRSADTGLRALLTQFHAGGSRGVEPPGASDPFFVKLLEYQLHPLDAAMASPPFELDDDPLGTGATRVCEAWLSQQGESSSATATIAIRLADLAIQSTSKLPPDIRLDALITTRSQRDVRHVARTWRGVMPGTPLSACDDVMFRGSVTDFVTLHLWISADTGGPDLADLLAGRPERTSTQSSPDDGSAVSWLAAAESAAVLVGSSYRALRDTTAGTTGVFRTCFLVREMLGKTGQIAGGRQSAGAVSFAVLVTRDGAGGAHV